jgi:short subunit fatty acids transporter
MENPEELELSVEDVFLRQEIAEKIQAQANDLTIYEGDEESNIPLRIVLNGKLRSAMPDIDCDVTLTTRIYSDGSEQVTLSISNFDYTFFDGGVVLDDSPDYYLGDDDLMKIRFWIRETRWQQGKVKPLSAKPQNNI